VSVRPFCEMSAVLLLCVIMVVSLGRKTLESDRLGLFKPLPHSHSYSQPDTRGSAFKPSLSKRSALIWGIRPTSSMRAPLLFEHPVGRVVSQELISN